MIVCRFLSPLLLGVLVLAGCASAPSGPVYEDSRDFRERAQVQRGDGFTVSAAALGLEESLRHFDLGLNDIDIQPVWLHIVNGTEHPQWMFPIRVDDDYFPPYEVARRAAKISRRSEAELYQDIAAKQIPPFIPPGATVSGFVFAHADEGLKSIWVDLHGRTDNREFHFLLPVPGLPTTYFDVADDPRPIQADLDLEGLRAWLETLPCCVTLEDDTPGDPLNLVFIGSLDELRGALVSRGWDVTAPVSWAALRRMAGSFLFNSRYRYAPISDLYLFEREQDMAFQKARAVIDERNHMRLWRAPVTHEGRTVWVGQISRDIGVKFTGKLWPPTTHVIDPDIDDARFYLLQDLLESMRLRRLGFVQGSATSTLDEPRQNGEGDPYFTDGLRAVMFLDLESVPLAEIENLSWELPAVMRPYEEEFFIEPAVREGGPRASAAPASSMAD